MRNNAKANLADASVEEQQAEFNAISEFIASGFEEEHPLNPEASEEDPSPPQAEQDVADTSDATDEETD